MILHSLSKIFPFLGCLGRLFGVFSWCESNTSVEFIKVTLAISKFAQTSKREGVVSPYSTYYMLIIRVVPLLEYFLDHFL